MKYHQLTYEERYTMARLRTYRISLPMIAAVLGRHRGTVWREVYRNRKHSGKYELADAQSMTNGRRRRSRRHRQFSERQFALVVKLLGKKWNPEQISQTLKQKGLLSISHETIYQYI